MREAIQKLNKKVLADEGGLSYSRLRKFATGEVKTLTEEEISAIHQFLIDTADVFTIKENCND